MAWIWLGFGSGSSDLARVLGREKDQAPEPRWAHSARHGVVGKLDAEPIVSRLDMGGSRLAQLVVVQVRMQIGQDRPPRPELLDQRERFVDAQMAGMRFVTQGVDDPDVEVGERREALRRQPDQVAGVGEPAKAEAERGDVAMLLQDRQAVMAPPAPSTCTGSPAAMRCSRAIGGYSLPGGARSNSRSARGATARWARRYRPATRLRRWMNRPRRSSMPWVWSACSCV